MISGNELLSPEEARAVRVAAMRVHSAFRNLSSYCLERRDLESVGEYAVVMATARNAGTLPITHAYTICSRRMLDHARSVTPLIRSAAPILIDSLPDDYDAEDSAPSPENQAIATELRECLISNRFGLSEKILQAMRLVYLLGLSKTEAARRLGVSLGTLWARVRLGIERMRVYLKLSCAPLAAHS
jgi:DNA-directed RNA polymerase specialized sigma24 family protein